MLVNIYPRKHLAQVLEHFFNKQTLTNHAQKQKFSDWLLKKFANIPLLFQFEAASISRYVATAPTRRGCISYFAQKPAEKDSALAAHD